MKQIKERATLTLGSRCTEYCKPQGCSLMMIIWGQCQLGKLMGLVGPSNFFMQSDSSVVF